MKKFEVSVVDSYGEEMDYCTTQVIEEETWGEAMSRMLRYMCRLMGISEDTPLSTIMGTDDYARFYNCRIVCNQIDDDFIRP